MFELALLLQVRSVPVATTRMVLSELAVKELKVVQMRTVEASLRLDAIASAGFRTSRSKIVDMIKKGDIRYPICCSHDAVTTSSTGLCF